MSVPTLEVQPPVRIEISPERKEGYVRWINDGAEIIRRKAKEGLGIDGPFDFLLTLGTGLNPLADKFDFAKSIVINDADVGLPIAKLEGHANEIILGVTKSGKKVALKKGRVHTYQVPAEGIDTPYGHFTAEETSTGYLRMFAKVGVKNAILTSAVGGIANPTNPGQPELFRNAAERIGVIVAADINDAYTNVLMGGHQELGIGERYPVWGESNRGLIEAYNASRKKVFRFDPARELVCVASQSSPLFENIAQVKDYAIRGINLLGMTTAPEVQVLSDENIKFLVLNLVTNVVRLFPKGGNRVLEAIKLIHGYEFTPHDYHVLQEGGRLIPSAIELDYINAADLERDSLPTNAEVIGYGDQVKDVFSPLIVDLVENFRE